MPVGLLYNACWSDTRPYILRHCAPGRQVLSRPQQPHLRVCALPCISLAQVPHLIQLGGLGCQAGQLHANPRPVASSGWGSGFRGLSPVSLGVALHLPCVASLAFAWQGFEQNGVVNSLPSHACTL